MRLVRLPALPGLLLLAVLAAPATAGEPRHFEDAALNAVQFVDRNEGWAVGDEGVVWHTIDGGRTWERQATGIHGSLRALHFLNPYSGWIAGREELPGGGSAGVLLTTQDGGLEWRRVQAGALPGLHWVHFLDAKLGYLAGDGTEAAPSGVHVTLDGGLTWKPVPGPRGASWMGGACAVDKGGNCKVALAGAWNRMATVRPERINTENVDQLGGRALCGMHFFGERGVAVGQGGLVLLGQDHGAARWGFAELPIADDARVSWDFHAVHGVGQRLWIVGRPGSVVLHSRDGGEHWEVQMTRQPLPLNGVFFVDEQRGWAVGELGTILATVDGGKSWQAQRRGGKRCPALLVHAQLTGVPLDTVAVVGGDEGYLTAVLGVTSGDPASASPLRSVDRARLAAAVRDAGGAAGETLWPFPIPAHLAGVGRDDVLRAWNDLHGGRAAEQLERQLVLALRVWRPNVVLTDSPEKADAASLITDAIRAACTHAGDPKVFPEQCSILGLEPWQPTKVYACCESQAQGQVTLDLTEASARLEATPREFAAAATALVTGQPANLPSVRRFRLLAGPESATGHVRLMQGVEPVKADLARRDLLPLEPTAAEAVVREVRQRARLLALAEAPATMADPNRLLGAIESMLTGMSDDHAARAIYAVAGQFARAGQWFLARETYLLLAERYPVHPLTAEALRWLIRHNSSSEARRRQELKQFIVHAIDNFGSPTGKVPVPPADRKNTSGNAARSPETGSPAETLRSLDGALLMSREETRQWYEGALTFEPRLAAFGPLFVDDPGTQFCLQAVRRHLGRYDETKEWYRQFAAHQPDGPWKSAAQAELWLAERFGPCPRPLARCLPTETRPFLDGKLDDPCWQKGQPLLLVNASGDTLKECPTEVRLAFDREYLYIAARCFHEGGRNVNVVRQRGHDADLSGHDRLSILLDLDRDYSTWFHLQVDERGLVAEDCWGDKRWDPRWFVAVRHELRCWVVEAAIPLAELTGEGVVPGEAWAFNAIRTLPGKGVQAWSLPAEVPDENIRPEGFGLLLFAPDAPRTTAGAAPAAVSPMRPAVNAP